MEKPIKATYRWTKEQFVRLQKIHMHHSKRLRRVFWFCRGMGVVVVTLGVMGWREHSLTLLGAICTVAFASFFFLLPQFTRLRVTKIYDRMAERDKEITYEISANGVSVSSAIADTEMSWREMHKVLRAPDGFLFYPAEARAYWLPVTAFKEAADAEKVAQVARASVRKYREVKS